jgi:hypothetical protein
MRPAIAFAIVLTFTAAAAARQGKPAPDDAVPVGNDVRGVTWGEVGIVFVLLDVTPAPLKGGTTTNTPCYYVQFLVLNQNPKTKVAYKTWRPKFGDKLTATLEDDLGNRYKPVMPPAPPLIGTDEANVTATARVSDALIFEPPVANAKYLVLTLPGENLGQAKDAKILLPTKRFDFAKGKAINLINVNNPFSAATLAKQKAEAEQALERERQEQAKNAGETEARRKAEAENKRAASKLDLARQLANSGDKAGALEYLKDLIKKYPDTPAAKEAKELIGQLSK